MSETTLGRGEQPGSLTAAALSVTAASLLLLCPFAHAAPTGGQVVSGSASISQSSSAGQSSTTISQSSATLSLGWQSFNVGKAETVNFVQPSASALAVNRIYDTQGSQILGRINANGQVWLINPNGVLFGKDAQVNVGALVASTLDTNAATGQTGQRFSGNSTAGITNLGQINAAQDGYVALLGHSVSNQGSINAPGGTVALGAGSAVSLNFAGSKLLGLQVNSNQLNALAENGGLIQATGGQVLLTAGARDSLLASVVNNSGVIQARTVQEQDGKIVLLGGMAAGTTTVSGTLDASAPQGGNGGFIETSAYTVNVSDSATITTASAHGTQGQWLLDPYDFYVKSSGGNITGAALGTALNSNNVTIQTTNSNTSVTGASATGGTAGNGDIFVNDAVSWSGNYALTLNAYNSIFINSAITATGTSGKLAMMYGQGTSAGGSSSYAVKAAVSLPAGSNFSTQLGSTGTTKSYTVITSLGSAGDENVSTATNSLQGLGYSTRLSGNYVLGADIAASGTATWNSSTGFSPIGDITTLFTGTFDGLGHTISGLTINRTSTDLVGLFGYTGTSAVIKNTGLTLGSVAGQYYVGSLAGFSQGTISNSYATGTVSGSKYVGGLVGAVETGTISSSYATGASSGTVANATVGGLAGQQYSGTISDSYASGSVSGTLYSGGLVGNAQGTITRSHATGAVSGSGTWTGGLVGALFTPGAISSSYATGAVTGTGTYNGGLAGLNSGTISSSYATGTVRSTQYSGGLVGTNNGTLSTAYANGAVSGSIAGGLVASNTGTTSTSYATGVVTGTSYAGGLAGQGTGTISSSYATGAVSGSGSYTGGLIGALFATGSITSSYATGTVTATGTYSGGLAGSNLGTIASSYATGAVSSSAQAGGLVGLNSGILSADYAVGSVSGTVVGGLVAGQGTAGTTSGSYATGSVTGTSFAGGLMGTNAGTVSTSYASGAVSGSSSTGGLLGALFNGGTISNSYATGAISSGTYRGGLVGLITATSYAVSNTYATGVVSSSGATNSGGLVGRVTDASTGSVSSSFWNSDNTSSTGYGSAGTGLSSTAMKTASSFSAWSISPSGGSSNTWRIYAGSTAPLLRSFLTSLATDTSTTYNGAVQYGIGHGLSNISGTVASGTHAGTYTSGTLYSNQQGYDLSGSGTLTIAKKVLAVSGTTAAGKTYDGNTSATITVGTLSGFVNSETLSATAIGTFDSKNAGTRSATATYTLVNGTGLAANYSLADTTGLSATIEKSAVDGLTIGADLKYSASWMFSEGAEISPVLWPQRINATVASMQIRSPGVRLPDSAYQRDSAALGTANTP